MTDTTEQTIRFEYDGGHKPFAKIVLLNATYQLLTGMIFRFWARTRERKYLWSHVRIGEDRLEYTGTGLELFLGFLIVMAVVMFPVIGGFTVLFLVFGDDPVAIVVVQLLYFVVLMFLINVAIYRARRYRLTRTVWRGIRGTLTGSSLKYGLAAMGYSVLAMVTVGLATPVMRIGLVRREIENMHFGNRPFTFHGKVGELAKLWILPWLSMPLLIGMFILSGATGAFTDPAAVEAGGGPDFNGFAAFGIVVGYIAVIFAMSWYRVAEFRYLAGSVGFEGMRFSSTLRFGRVFWIYLSTYLVLFALVLLVLAGLVGAVFGLADWGLLQAAAASENFDPETVMAGIDEQRFAAVVMLLFFLYGIGAHVVSRVFLFHRMARAVVTSLALVGEQDFSQITQALDEAPSVGEGLADAFDLGDF